MSDRSRYAWIIDRDRLEDGEDSAVGTIGPRDAEERLIQRLRDGDGVRFRMLDDDGEVYYDGRIVWRGPIGDIPCAPLDDFGTPNAGCASIEYPRNPEWNCG